MRRLLPTLLTALLVLLSAAPALAADEIAIYLNGQPLTFDAAPFMESGRTLVPLRGLSEALGFEVGYRASDGRISLTRGNTMIEVWVNSNRVVVNGQEETVDVPVTTRNGRSYVPVRFVAEKLGAQVTWDGARNAVVVNTAGQVAAGGRGTAQGGGQAGGQSGAGSSGQPETQAGVGAASQEALALLRKSVAYNQTVRDQKMTGELQYTMTVAGTTMQMPATLAAHIHEGNMLMTMEMEMPGLPQESMRMQAALRDGVAYTHNSLMDQWLIVGEYDPQQFGSLQGFTDLEGMEGMSGLFSAFQFQDEIISQSTVTVAGSEVIDGVTTTRLDVAVSPQALNDLMNESLAAMALPAGQVPDMQVERYNYSIWVDPETGFTPRTAMDLSLKATMDDPQSPEPMTFAMAATGEMRTTLVSEPIAWPDLSGAVPMGQVMPELEGMGGQ